jgi:hypothetical protein
LSPAIVRRSLQDQGAELLAIGLASPQDRDVLDAANLIEAHHAVEAFLEQQSIGITETERLGREQDDPSVPLALHPFDGDARPFAARRIQAVERLLRSGQGDPLAAGLEEALEPSAKPQVATAVLLAEVARPVPAFALVLDERRARSHPDRDHRGVSTPRKAPRRGRSSALGQLAQNATAI